MAIDDYDPLIMDAAQQWNVHPWILKGIMQQESGGNPNARSGAGAAGLMGIMPGTAKDLGVTDVTDPKQNIFAGAKYLRQMTDQFGSTERGLQAYNAGPGKAAAVFAGKDTFLPETQAYLPAVASHYAQYAKAGTPIAQVAPPADNSDLIKQLMPTPAPAAPGKTAPVAPAPADNSDLIKQLMPSTPGAATPGTPSTTEMPPSVASGMPQTPREAIKQLTSPAFSPQDAAALTAGQGQALGNIGITANRALAGVGNALGSYDPGLSAFANQNLARMTATRDANTAKYGDNGAYQLGNMVGSGVATLPIMAAANPLVARGASYGVNALGNVAPALGRVAAPVVDFLGGSAGQASGVPGGAVVAARPVVNTLSNVASGALQGGEAAAINSGQSDQPLGQQVAQGALAGGAVGAVPAVLGHGFNALSGAAGSLDPEMANLAQKARDMYGVQLKAPQLGLNPSLAYANNTLKYVPGSGVGADEAATQAQWQQAVNREMGVDSPKIFGTTINGVLKRAGQVMEDVGNRTDLNLNTHPTALTDLANIEQQARQPISGLDERQINQVQAHIDKIQDVAAANGGIIPGSTYLKLVKTGESLDNLRNSQSTEVAHFGDRIKGVLDDVLQSSATPQDAAALQQARYQYKVAKTVQPLTARSDSISGPQPTAGDISPVALRQAVLNPRAFGPNAALNDWGETPLWDLARIGQRMRDPSQSGTQPREAVQDALSRVGRLGVGALMAGGGGYGAYTGEIPLALGALAGGVTAGRAIGAGLRSSMLANRMIDSSLNPLAYQITPNPLARTALSALAGPRANRLSSDQ